jgi:hypothetical protein
MAQFNYEIPQEYMSQDFGFTTVDADEFDRQHQVEEDISREVAGEVSSSVASSISQVESKIDAILLKLSSTGEDQSIDLRVDLQRLEEKVDSIVSMETDELSRAIQDQSEGIRAVIDEVEERKSALNAQYQEKLVGVEKLVLPLLINLTKNADQEYLYWPDRAENVQNQIQKILECTRS